MIYPRSLLKEYLDSLSSKLTVMEHLVKLHVSTKGSKIQKQFQESEGEVCEVTITNYHCGVLFVLLSPVRYEVCQHGCFHFRLASVARSGT